MKKAMAARDVNDTYDARLSISRLVGCKGARLTARSLEHRCGPTGPRAKVHPTGLHPLKHGTERRVWSFCIWGTPYLHAGCVSERTSGSQDCGREYTGIVEFPLYEYNRYESMKH